MRDLYRTHLSFFIVDIPPYSPDGIYLSAVAQMLGNLTAFTWEGNGVYLGAHRFAIFWEKDLYYAKSQQLRIGSFMGGNRPYSELVSV